MSEPPALRVLLIDDDVVDRMAVKRALATAKLDVVLTEAIDFEAARAALASVDADCVLLDYHLPDGDGRDVLALAASTGLDVPIIVLTGHGDESLAADSMRRGAADYLAKGSLSPERLAQSIRHALRVRALQRSERRAQELLARQNEQLRRLAEATLRVHGAATEASALAIVAEETRGILGARVAVATLDRAGQPPLCHVVAARPEDEAHAAELPLRTAIVGRDGEPIGSLSALPNAIGEVEASDVAVLLQLARNVSVAIENTRLVVAAKAAAAARDEVLAIVSHDLRNPLSAIVLSAAMMRETLAGPDGQDGALALVARIDRGAKRMNRLIEDLLDASRIDAGGLTVNAKDEAASALVGDAIEAAQSIADARGCRVRRGVIDDVRVRADRDRIQQLFSNLVGNALKFSPKGGAVTLAVRCDGETAWFSVEDNGPGIDAGHVGRVFHRYWRAPNATSRDGAGLGLFIARGIAEAHGGAIRLESQVGQGTRVEFSLPVAR